MKYIGKKVLINTLVLILLIFLSKTTVSAENISSNYIGTVTAKVLNLRQAPETSSKVLAKIKQGEQVKIISNSNKWSKVKYKNIEGWIFSSHIKISAAEQKLGTVNVNILKVRKSPNTTAIVISKLQKGKTFQILDVTNKWYKIKTSDGITGWVYTDYVTLNKTEEPRKTSTAISRGSEKDLTRVDEEDIKTGVSEEMPVSKELVSLTSIDIGVPSLVGVEQPINTTESEVPQIQQLVDYAKTFIGTKYVYGGSTPEEGFDCSGYTKYIFSKFNINLDRTAASQAMQGIEASKDELAVGDLVFFDTTGNGKNINHVGIYLGENNFIHAASGRYNVTITSLSDSYYLKSYMTARRVLTVSNQ